MKAALLTAAAALMGSAMAHEHHRRHDHAALHRRQSEPAQESCGCYTSVVTYWGSPTLVPIAAEPTTTSTSTTTYLSTSYSTVTVQASTPVAPLPTASVTVFPTPGTYTIPGSTVTVTSSTVVPEATTTALTSGTHTIGGVTTVVETSTTVVCPYATVKPTGSTVTTVIETTSYVCPSAGTYTIAPTTTTVPASTVVVYPTPATVTPGTYTQPEQTVTVVETSYTYVCPFATSSTPAPAPAAPTTTAAAVPPPAPVAPTSAAPVAAHTTAASPPPASTSPATSGSTGSGCGLGKHDQYAVTYTGYTHDTGACMAADEVLTELKNIQANGFYAIRMYSTDCNQLETVASQAISIGLQVILGVYIGQGGVSTGSSQVNDIVNWGKSNGWKGVEFISLDNEALSDGYCSASELASFVSSAKSTLKGAGYSGQFTVTEPLNVWQSSGSTLCGVVDFASANLQAFFNGDVAAEEAGSFVASEVEILKKICNNEQVFVGESGWPTSGDTNGKAVPGAAEQKAAIDGIRSSIGSIAAQFSYKNDHWKSPGSLNVEQFWGISDMLSSAE